MGTALQRHNDGFSDIPSPLCKGVFHSTQGNLHQDGMVFGLEFRVRVRVGVRVRVRVRVGVGVRVRVSSLVG